MAGRVELELRHEEVPCPRCSTPWHRPVGIGSDVCPWCEVVTGPEPAETCDVCGKEPATKVDYGGRLRCRKCSAGVVRGWVKRALGGR